MKTVTTWIQEQEFESRQDECSIRLDGRGKKGMSPKALLLSGLAGCSGIDVVDILEKMRVKFSSLNIETETDQTDDHPKVFKDILITFIIHSDPSNESKVRKAIDLSLEKYCGVAAMLGKNSPISYKLVIQ